MAVACRVLGFSTQTYYKWLKNPFSAREIEERELIGKLHELHEEDPEGGTVCLPMTWKTPDTKFPSAGSGDYAARQGSAQ